MFLSTFTTVLRLYVASEQKDADNTLRVLLESVVRECTILKPEQFVSLNVLVLSLQGLSDAVYKFLDNCVLRFVRKPVKYHDALLSLSDEVQSSQTEIGRLDLLLLVVLEQWPFLTRTLVPSDQKTSVAEWLARYLNLLVNAGGDLTLLSQIRDRLRSDVEDRKCHEVLEKAFDEPAGAQIPGELQCTLPPNRDMLHPTIVNRGEPKRTLHPQTPLPPGPPAEDQDHFGLRKWTHKDVQEAIEDGSIEDLIYCLCSKYGEIRKEAQKCLRAFMTKLEVGTPSSSTNQC